jgi:MerR family transcriptional regulator, thiopeptide resistance regulator
MGCEMDTDPDITPHGEPALRTVAQVARLAGVTVRTLHHYDELGLLQPSERSEAGYRLYTPADVTRLRELLTWRRLGVPLREIAGLLDEPADAARLDVLRRQRALVRSRLGELRRLASALDDAIAATHDDTTNQERTAMAPTDPRIIEALDGFDPAEYEAEAAERWGDSHAYRESARRTRDYTPEQWTAIKAEAEQVTEHLAALWSAGADPTSAEARAGAEQHRAHVTRWFYRCSTEIHRGLGEMYVADPRFTTAWEGEDGARAGFAAWVRDAFVANADALDAGSPRAHVPEPDSPRPG